MKNNLHLNIIKCLYLYVINKIIIIKVIKADTNPYLEVLEQKESDKPPTKINKIFTKLIIKQKYIIENMDRG